MSFDYADVDVIGLVLAIALPHTWMTWKFGGRFMLAMVIAEYSTLPNHLIHAYRKFYSFVKLMRLVSRFGLHLHPESHSLYILEYLFVVLSPCGFIATEYVLLGRLARWLKASQHVLIPPNRITLVFVLSDVSTFLIQVGDR